MLIEIKEIHGETYKEKGKINALSSSQVFQPESSSSIKKWKFTKVF